MITPEERRRQLRLSFIFLAALVAEHAGLVPTMPAELPPPGEEHHYVLAEWWNPVDWVKGGCDVLDSTSFLPSCDHVIPVVGTALAYGACAVATAAVAATPCIAGAALSVGVSTTISVVSDPAGCTQSLERAYEQCLTANWGATKEFVRDLRQDEATLMGGAGAALDLVGSALPVQFAASTGTKAAWQAARKEGDNVVQAGLAGIRGSKPIAFAENVVTGGGKNVGPKITSWGSKLRAEAAETALKRTGTTRVFPGVAAKDALSASELSKLKWSPRNLGGIAAEKFGAAYRKPLVSGFIKGSDILEGAKSRETYLALNNVGVNAVKANAVDQAGGASPPFTTPDPTRPGPPPPEDTGVTTTGPPGRQVTLTVLSPPPGSPAVYVSGAGTPVSFRIQADAGVASWFLWMGNLRLGGHTLTDGPAELTETLHLNMPDHPWPAGHYALTLIASDASQKAERVIRFSIATEEGHVPDVDRSTSASCQNDLNRNGYPDCVDTTTTYLAAPGRDGKPNWLAITIGLVILLGILGFAAFYFRGGS